MGWGSFRPEMIMKGNNFYTVDQFMIIESKGCHYLINLLLLPWLLY